MVPLGSPHWVPFNRAAITMPAPIPVPGWSGHRDAEPPPAQPDDPLIADLSPSVRRVGNIANWNGDRVYIVVDKIHGKLILFEHGRPTLIRPALTGASLADQFPPDAIAKSVHEQRGGQYKVTPAGRFTLNHAFDRGLGRLLDINEIHGRDWGLAIHQVWLGNRS